MPSAPSWWDLGLEPHMLGDNLIDSLLNYALDVRLMHVAYCSTHLGICLLPVSNIGLALHCPALPSFESQLVMLAAARRTSTG